MWARSNPNVVVKGVCYCPRSVFDGHVQQVILFWWGIDGFEEINCYADSQEALYWCGRPYKLSSKSPTCHSFPSVLKRLLLSDCQHTWMITNCFLIIRLQYQRFHSTETALLCVLSDLTLVLESGKLALLTLLDTSTAFDTVDHEILLRCLDATYGILNGALKWITSYLLNHIEKVHVNSYTSPYVPLKYSVH